MSAVNGNGFADPSTETEAAFIVRRMRELGFQPSPGFESGRVVFYKDYADDEGRRVRTYAFFDKPIMGLPGIRLNSFVVSAQFTLQPSVEDVEREAPEVIRGDLYGVIDAFKHYIGHVPDQSVMLKTCVKCDKPHAQFYIVNGDAICKPCVDARRARKP